MARYGALQLALPAPLCPYQLQNARNTGITLGQGNYGSVHELDIAGRLFAGKVIYETLITDEIVEKFYEQCILLSQIRHPHIVPFAGMCSLPGYRLPILVMEKLHNNLGYVLKTRPNIPLSTKLSIIHDIASGLAYLHHIITPAVIHGNLTSRSVLLSEDMTAKIAGMDCFQRVNQTRLTSVPGPPLYMPPEAFTGHYSISLDMFSFGHLSLYVSIQTSLVELLSKMFESSGKQIARTELERREKYIQKLVADLGKDHALALLIQQCLQDEAAKRPTALEALEKLLRVKAPPPPQQR